LVNSTSRTGARAGTDEVRAAAGAKRAKRVEKTEIAGKSARCSVKNRLRAASERR